MSSKSSHCAHNACSSIGNTYIHTYANINTPTHADNVFGQILKAYFCGRVFCLPPAVWTLALALATALALGLFVLPLPTALPSGLCCYPCSSSSSSDSTSWSSCHTMPHLQQQRQQQQQRLRLVPAISK